MKERKFTDSQIIGALKRTENGIAVSQICRDLGIDSTTFYKWRAIYGGMDVSLMQRMKKLASENALLRKMTLEEKIEAEIVSEALEKSGKAIFPQRDGNKDCGQASGSNSCGLFRLQSGSWMLPLPAYKQFRQ